jgi:hypothetical protein
VNISDEVAWVRRVNDHWIVRQNLRESAAAYLDHLAGTDPERLQLSCAGAKHLTETFGKKEDPKPWFYAGLFRMATEEEAKSFLAKHKFTYSAISGLDEANSPMFAEAMVHDHTAEKLRRIRQALQNLGSNQVVGGLLQK